MSFAVGPSEIGTPLDKAFQAFFADFKTAYPNVTVTNLESPPDFDNQILVDLAAGTAPDVWGADASTLARLISTGYLLDMRKCVEVDPTFNMDRFYPNLLAITTQPDGSIYGVPNNGTPMVVFYNPETFAKYNVPVPQAGWTWDDLLTTAQALTTDANGKHPTDAAFDANNVVTWGYRVRKYTMEWIYRVWENGGDVISPDGTTASGYLDSAATREALQFNKDLVLKYHVSPPPTTLDSMVSALGFPDQMLTGHVAMYERGHWELVGIYASPNYNGNNLAVAPEPTKVNGATVAYYSVTVINKAVENDPARLQAACAFVNAATGTTLQDTYAISGIALPANIASAEKQATTAKDPALETVFTQQLTVSTPPYGSKYAKWPAIETILDSMMERILAGGDVTTETSAAVVEINRELTQQ
jgi:multiple sugar transport system substrate-binding protein